MQPVPYGHGLPAIESDQAQAVINAWLQSKDGISGSKKTARAYRDTLGSFRGYLQSNGLDILATRGDQLDCRAIALAAQRWHALPNSRDGSAVEASTKNHRLAVLSSFYKYLARQDIVSVPNNPIDRVERAKVQAYRYAQPKTADQISAALDSIDRSTLLGMRNYALLALGVYAGRRVNEITMLTLADIEDSGGEMLIWFRHCKGGKVMRDFMPPVIREAMLDYLVEAFGTEWRQAPQETRVWVSFSRRRVVRPLGRDAVEGLCVRYLGTSQTHVLRHTAAVSMEDIGMSLTEIQERLGHRNAKTTSDYLKSVRAGRNRKGDELAAHLGIRARA